MNDYYQLYRILKFEKTRALLREGIIDQLNNTLKRIGRKIGFNVKIEVVGMKSSQDIEDMMKGLNNGTTKFMDIPGVGSLW